MTVAELAIDERTFLTPIMDRGVSQEAATVKSRMKEMIADRLMSLTLGGLYLEALAALEDAAEESSTDNWDGYGAKAISRMTYANAARLLLTLPTTLPAPEVAVEPDGEVAFEWFKEPRRVLSVSIGPDNEISYAGLFGRSKTHGTEYFADELPKAIVENLARLFYKER
jgi:hypothetical protein